jgi:hypothetical protein
MESFSEYLEEKCKLVKGNIPPNLDFKISKKDDSKSKGLVGEVTAHFSKPIKLPVKKLIKIPGADGEERNRTHTNTPQAELLIRVIKKPHDFHNVVNPITIGVDKEGKAFIMDGNHRIGFAYNHGVKWLKAVVKYYNGGENTKGKFSPKNIKKMRIK